MISKKTLVLLTGLQLVPVVGPINIQIVMNVKFTTFQNNCYKNIH